MKLQQAMPEGLSVEVLDADGVRVPAGSLFQDKEWTTPLESNPAVVDTNGEFTFYAASGWYRLLLGGQGTAVDLTWNGGAGKLLPFMYLREDDQVTVNGVRFSTSPTVDSTAEGNCYWNSGDHTADIHTGLGGVVVQIGQELLLLVYVPANAAEDLLNGWPISLDGSSGLRPIGYRTDLTSEASCRCFMGLATMDIPRGTHGFVTMKGLVRGINTSAFEEGDRLWVTSVAPYLSASEPVAGQRVLVGMVLTKGAQGIVFSSPRHFELTAEMKAALLADGSFSGKIVYSPTYIRDNEKSLVGINPVGPSANPTLDPDGEGWRYAGASTDNVAVVMMQINHEAKQGVQNIIPHVHWRKTTAVAGNVKWRLEAKSAPVGGDFGPYVQVGTDVTAPIGGTVDNNSVTRHLISSFGEMAINIGLSTLICFRLSRIASDTVGDTYPDEALAMSFDYHYETDSPGSVTQYSKE